MAAPASDPFRLYISGSSSSDPAASGVMPHVMLALINGMLSPTLPPSPALNPMPPVCQTVIQSLLKSPSEKSASDDMPFRSAISICVMRLNPRSRVISFEMSSLPSTEPAAVPTPGATAVPTVAPRTAPIISSMSMSISPPKVRTGFPPMTVKYSSSRSFLTRSAGSCRYSV